ncbi:hypothetical protein DIPPA_31365 [Diplonema papillatum]|nr:hypothetical protein DIPPA_31365 [Diplonema papillatum]
MCSANESRALAAKEMSAGMAAGGGYTTQHKLAQVVDEAVARFCALDPGWKADRGAGAGPARKAPVRLVLARLLLDAEARQLQRVSGGGPAPACACRRLLAPDAPRDITDRTLAADTLLDVLETFCQAPAGCCPSSTTSGDQGDPGDPKHAVCDVASCTSQRHACDAGELAAACLRVVGSVKAARALLMPGVDAPAPPVAAAAAHSRLAREWAALTALPEALQRSWLSRAVTSLASACLHALQFVALVFAAPPGEPRHVLLARTGVDRHYDPAGTPLAAIIEALSQPSAASQLVVCLKEHFHRRQMLCLADPT